MAMARRSTRYEGIESLAQLGARTVISLRRGQTAVNAEREKVESVEYRFRRFRIELLAPSKCRSDFFFL